MGTVSRKRLGATAFAVVATLVVTTLVIHRSDDVTGRLAKRSAKLGELIAEQTIQQVGRQGDIVVRTFASPENPIMSAQLQAFTAYVQQHSSLRIVAVEPTGDVITMRADRFAALIKKYPDAAAFVLLGVLPELPDGEVTTLGPLKCKVLATGFAGPPHRELFERGLLHVAITPPTDVADTPASAPPLDEAQEVDSFYRVYSTNNLTELPR